MFSPHSPCAFFKNPVVSKRSLDSLLDHIIEQTLDVNPVQTQIHVLLVGGKRVCGISVLGVQQPVFAKHRVFLLLLERVLQNFRFVLAQKRLLEHDGVLILVVQNSKASLGLGVGSLVVLLELGEHLCGVVFLDLDRSHFVDVTFRVEGADSEGGRSGVEVLLGRGFEGLGVDNV